MLALAVDTLLGIATVVLTLAGLSMTIFSYVSGRKDATRKAEQVCNEKLLEEHKISTALSEELREMKRKYEGGGL
jgi:hypothetical protein